MDKKKRRNYIIAAVAAVVLIFILAGSLRDKKDTEVEFAQVYKGKFVVSVSAVGTLEAENSVDIKGPNISGKGNIRAENVTISDLVTDGTVVKKGDYVATLDRSSFENNLRSYQEQLTTLLTTHSNLLLDSAATLSKARNNIQNQEFTVENARTTLKNSRYESAGTIRNAELTLQQEETSLEQQKKSYQLTYQKIIVNINKSLNDIAKMRKRIADYQDVLKEFYITAPADGMVVYAKDRGEKIKSGSSIRLMGNIVATLPDMSSMVSKVYVGENDINKIKVGQEVQITVDAFPSKSYTGKVIKAAKVGEVLANSSTKSFEVTIKMDKVDSQIRPDMTTTNLIKIADYNDVMFIPTEAVQTGTDSVNVVYTKSGLRQEVFLGDANDDYVIVTDGLKEGETIYLSMPDKPGKFRFKEIHRKTAKTDEKDENNFEKEVAQL